MNHRQNIQDQVKPLPQCVELEEAVLGAMLLERAAPGKALDWLRPEMFYKEAHQIIFRAMEEMYAAGQPIDILTVTNHLQQKKLQSGGSELNQVGGAYYISCLTARIASDANLEFHCRIIIQKWCHRMVIYHGSLAVNRSYNDDPDIFGVFDDLTDLILIRDKLVTDGSDVHAVSDLVNLEIERYNDRAAANQTGILTGINTGLIRLNRLTMGWHAGKLVIVAARPGMGKTALVGKFAIEAARVGVGVGFFSLEMSDEELMQRFVTGIAEVDNYRYNRGQLGSGEMMEVNNARDELTRLPIYIDDTPGISITTLRSKARRLKQKYGIGMLIVDYLQLMEGKATDKRNGNREQEISSISRGLKSISKELELPVIALSQLSRAVETRGGDKRPQLSDLRESGAIEQDADMVMFIHRPDYYDKGTDQQGIAEIIIAKNRGGDTTTIVTEFIAKSTTFKDAPEDRPKYQTNSIKPNVNFYEAKKDDPF